MGITTETAGAFPAVRGAKRIAGIFNEPHAVLFAEFLNRVQVEGIAQRDGDAAYQALRNHISKAYETRLKQDAENKKVV